MRRDYTVGLNITETAVDDPDPPFYENYVCGAQRNYTGYCDAQVDKMVSTGRSGSPPGRGRGRVCAWRPSPPNWA